MAGPRRWCRLAAGALSRHRMQRSRPMLELRDKVAVVTGGGSGIGAALARAFAEQGMDVAVADVDVAGAEKVAADVRAAGRRALSVATDVSKLASVEALAAR